MPQEQNPPKEQVDLFDILQAASSKEKLDPLKAAYQLGIEQLKGNLEFVLDPQKIIEKHNGTGKYAGSVGVDGVSGDLLTDIGEAQAILAAIPQKEVYARAFEPTVHWPGNVGKRPSIPAPELRQVDMFENPFSYTSTAGGKERAWQGSFQQQAEAIGLYMSPYTGEMLPLEPGWKSSGRNFEIREAPVRTPGGQLVMTKVLRDKPDTEEVYGSEMYSRYGAQSRSDGFWASMGKGTWSSFSQFWAATGKTLLDDSMEQRKDLLGKLLMQMDPSIVDPDKFLAPAQVQELLGRGNWSSSSIRALVDPDGNSAKLADYIDSVVEKVGAEHADYVQRAGRGDAEAQAALQLYNAAEGVHDKGKFQRFSEAFSRNLQLMSMRPSEEAEGQGAFGGLDGFGNLIGQINGFLASQMLVGGGVTSALTKVGGSRLVSRSLVGGGLTPTLTRTGARTAYGITSAYPGLVMGQQMYDTAREAGYGHGWSVAAGVAAMPMVMFTETVMGVPWMNKALVAAGGKGQLQKTIEKELLKEVEKSGGKQLSKGALGRVMQKSYTDWINKGAENMAANIGRRAIGHTAMETAQEVSEEGMYMFVEALTDAISGQDLFDKSRDFDYSGMGRLWETAASTFAGVLPMGVIHGYRMRKVRRDDPHDRGLSYAVGQGQGKEILRKADQMRRSGAISQEEFDAVSQTVSFSEDVINNVKVNNPEVFEVLFGQGSIAGDYAAANAEIVNAKERLAPLEEQAKQMKEGGDTAGLAEVEAKIKVEQEIMATAQRTIDQIADGTTYVDRLKENMAIVDAMEKNGGKFPENYTPFHGLVTGFAEWRKKYIEQWGKRKQQLEGSKEAFDNILAKVSELGGKDAATAKQVVEELASLLGSEGFVMSRERAGALYSAIQQELGKAHERLMKSKALVTGGSEDQAAPLSEIFEADELGEDMGFEDWFKDMADNNQLLFDEEGVDASYVWSSLSGSRNFLGEDDAAREAKLAGMEDEASINSELTKEQIVDTFMEDGFTQSSLRTSYLLEKAKLMKTPTKEFLDELRMAIAGLDTALRFQDAVATSYGKAAQVVKDLPGKHPVRERPGVKAFLAEDEHLYQPTREGKEARAERLEQLRQELKAEHARLDKELSRLNSLISDMRKVDLAHRADLAEQFMAAVPSDVKIPKEAFDHLKVYKNEAANPKPNMAVVQAQVDALEAILSKVMVEDRTKNGGRNLLAFASKLLAPDKDKASGARAFFDTLQMDVANFPDTYTADLMRSPAASLAQYSFKMRVLAGWLSRLSRTDYAKMVTEYDRMVGEKNVAHNEQRNQIFDIVTFILEPDPEFTAKLLRIGLQDGSTIKTRQIRNAYAVQGIPGVGKSAVIVRKSVELYRRLKGSRAKVAILTPGERNGADLEASLMGIDVEAGRTSLGQLSSLRERKPDLIIIDEAQVLDAAMVEAVRQVMEDLPGTSLVFLGDAMQSPGLADPSQTYPARYVSFHGLPLQAVFRLENTELVEFADTLRGYSKEERSGFTRPAGEITTRYTAAGDGVRFTGSKDDTVKAFLAHMESTDPALSKDAILIVKDRAQRDEVLARADFPEKYAGQVLWIDSGEHSALSGSRDMAFIAMEPQDFKEHGMRFMYTAVTRARRGVVVPWAKGRSVEVEQVGKMQSDRGSKEIWDEAIGQSTVAARAVQPYMDKATAEEGTVEAGADSGTSSNEGPEQAPVSEQDDVQEEPQEQPQQGPHPPKQPTGPAPDEDTAGGTIPKEGEPPAPKSTLVSRTSAEQTGYMVGNLTGLIYNPDFPNGTDEALSVDNPIYRARMALIQALNDLPDKPSVRLIKRSSGEYNSSTGKYTGPAFEVHLNDEHDMVGAVEGMTGIRPSTFLGLMYLNTQATDDYKQQSEEAKRLLASEDWKDGESYPGYDDIPLNGFHPGAFVGSPQAREAAKQAIRKGEKPKQEWYPISELYANAARLGQVLSAPFMRTKEHPGKLRGVIIQVSPWPGGPVTEVAVRTKRADKPYWDRMLAEAEEMVRSDADSDTVRRSEAHSFLQWNRKDIVDLFGHLSDEDQKSLSAAVVHKGDGRITLNYSRLPDGSPGAATNLLTALKSLKKIGEQAPYYQGADKALRLFDRPTKSTKDLLVHIANPEDVEVSALRVNLPMMTLAGKFQAPGSGQSTSDDIRGSSRKGYRRSEKQDGSPQVARKSIEEARHTVSRLLGDKFVNNELEFHPDLSVIYGKDLYGVMDRGRILLEARDGTVRSGVDRHEALHYVLDHLVTKETKERILADIRDRLIRDGMRPALITDEMVNEYAANGFERKRFDTTTLSGRFLAWLHGVLTRFGLLKDSLADLYYRIERGEFRDAPVLNQDISTRYSEQTSNDDALLEKRDENMRGLDKNSKRALLLKVFHNPGNVETITRVVMERVNNLTAFSNPSLTNLRAPKAVLGYKEAAQEIFRRCTNALKQNPGHAIVGGQEVSFDAMDLDTLLSLSPDEQDLYTDYHLANQEVFEAIISDRIPGFRANKQGLLDEFGDQEVDNNVDDDSAQGNANIHNSNELIDWMSKSSTLAKLILETTYPVNEKLETYFHNGPVDSKLMISIVRRIAQETLMKLSPGEDFLPVYARAVALYAKEKQGTVEGELARTFYVRFISDTFGYKSEGKSLSSYFFIVSRGPSIVEEHPEGSIERVRAQQLVDAAHQVISNVVMPMLSTSGLNRSVSKHFQFPAKEGSPVKPRPGFRHISVGFDPTASIHNEMNEGLRSGYIPSASGFKLDPEFRVRWSVGASTDKEGYSFKVTKSGVQDASGKYLVKRITEGRMAGFYELRDVDSAMVRQFMNAAGHNVSARTVEYLLRDDAGRHELGQLISYWAMAIHSSIHAIESEAVDPKLFSNEFLDFVKPYAGMAKESPDDFLGNEPGTSKGQALYLPSSFFVTNKAFASTEMRTRGAAYDQRVIGARGSVIHPIAMQTPFTNTFPGAVNETGTYMRVRNLGEKVLRHSPWLRTGDRWNNPFLDPESNFTPGDVEITTGVTSNTALGGVETKDMTLADLVLVRFDQFVRTYLRSRGKEIVVPGSGYADRGEIPIFHFYNTFRSESLGRVVSGKEEASVRMSKHLLFDPMGRAMESIIARRRHSVRLWRGEMVRWGLLTEEQAKDQALVLEAMELVTEDMVRRSPVLTKHSDWKVVDGKVVFGNRIDLSHEKVYTPDLIGRYMEVRKRQMAGEDVREDMAQLFNDVYEPHLAEFRSQVAKWDFRTPTYNGKPFSPAGTSALHDMFFMMNHFAQVFSNELVLGDDAGYSSQGDADKRSVLGFSPGQRPWVGRFGLPKQGRMVIFADQDKRWDGQSYTSPFHHVRAKKAFGGPTGMISDGPNKRVLVSGDVLVKSSDLHISRDMYYSDVAMREMLDRSLLFRRDDGSEDDSLLALWMASLGEGEASHEQYWEAVDIVQRAADEMGVALTDLFTADSNVKKGLRGLNFLGEEGPLTTLDFEMEDWIAQTKLDRSLDERDLEVAYFGQLSFLAGLSSSPKDYMGRLHGLEAEMAHQYLDRVNELVEASSGNTRQEKVANFLRNHARNSFNRTHDLMSQAGYLLMSPEVDINNPIVARKVVETFSTVIKKDALLPKMPGQYFTQASSSFMLNPSTGKPLAPPGVVDGKYVPGEVVVSVKAFAKYGLRGDVRTIEQAVELIKADAARRGLSEQETAKLLSDFGKDLTVFVARTPASSMGSGQLMRVVGFVNDAGNVIFVPPGFNKFTGGDNDGDQLAVYLRSDRDRGRRKEGKRDLRTVQMEIMDLIEEYYLDEDNAELVSMMVGTDLLEEVLLEVGDAPTLASTLAPGTILQTMAAKRQASAGANLIGIGASMMRAYAVMYRSMMDMTEQQRAVAFPGIAPALRDSDGRLVIENIGAVLNGMLDNTKHGHMGRLGVTEDNVILFMGALMGGKTIKEAVEFIRSAIVKSKLDEIEISSTLSMSDQKDFMESRLTAEFFSGDMEQIGSIPNAIMLGEFASSLIPYWNLATKGLDYRLWAQHLQQMRMEYAAGASFEELISNAPGDAIEESFPVQKNYKGEVAWQTRLRRQVAKAVNAPAVITRPENHMGFLSTVNSLRGIIGEAITQGTPGYRRLLTEMALDRGLPYLTNEQAIKAGQLFDAMVVAVHMAEQWHGKPVKLRMGYAPMDLSTKGGQYRFLTEFPEFLQGVWEKALALPQSDPRRQLVDSNKFLDEIRAVGNFRKRFEMRDGRKVFNDPELLKEVRDGLASISEIFTPDLMPRGFKFDGDFLRLMETYILLKDGSSQSRASMSRFLTDTEIGRMASAYMKVDRMVREGVPLELPTGRFRWMSTDEDGPVDPSISEHGKRWTQPKEGGLPLLSRLLMDQYAERRLDQVLFDFQWTPARAHWTLSTQAYNDLYRGRESTIEVPPNYGVRELSVGDMLMLPTGDPVVIRKLNPDFTLVVSPAAKQEMSGGFAEPSRGAADRPRKTASKLNRAPDGRAVVDSEYLVAPDVAGKIAKEGVDERARAMMEVVVARRPEEDRERIVVMVDGVPVKRYGQMFVSGQSNTNEGVAYRQSNAGITVVSRSRKRSAMLAEYTSARVVAMTELLEGSEGLEQPGMLLNERIKAIQAMISDDTVRMKHMEPKEFLMEVFLNESARNRLKGLRMEGGLRGYSTLLASFSEFFGSSVSTDYMDTLIAGPANREYMTSTVSRSPDATESFAYGDRNAGLDGKSLAEAVTIVGLSSSNTTYVRVAKGLKPFMDKFATGNMVKALSDFGSYGYINKAGEVGYLAGMDNQNVEATILHEGIHRATLGVLTADKGKLGQRELKYREAMDALFEHYSGEALKAGYRHPGLENTAEFVATAMTDPEFVKELKMRKSWNRLVGEIMQLLGLDARGNDFEQLVDLTLDYVQETVQHSRDAFRHADWQGKDVYNRGMAESLGVHLDQYPVKDLKSLMNNLMTNVGDISPWEGLSDDAMVNMIISRYVDMDSSEITVKGVTFDPSSMTPVQVREFVKERLVPLFGRRPEKIKEGITEVLNELVSEDGFWGQSSEELSAKVAEKLGISVDVAELLMEQVQHKPGAVYMKYSDLAQGKVPVGSKLAPSLTYDDLGVPYIPEFEGFDPLVQVYKDGSGTTNISLVDFVGGMNPSTGGKYLLDNYVKGWFTGMTKKLQVQRDTAGAKQFALALMAMAIRAENPSIKFGGIKVLSVGQSDISHRTAWMPDMVHEVAHIRDTPALFDHLPENMKAVISNEDLYDGTAYNQPFLQQYMDFIDFKDDSRKVLGLNHIRRAGQDYLKSDRGRPEMLLKALYARQRALREGRSPEGLAADKEYNLLSQLIIEVKEVATLGRNITRDTSKIGANLKNAHDMDHDLVQLLIRTTERSVMKINHLNRDFRVRLNGALEEYAGKRVSNLTVLDTGWKRFERLWRWREAEDRSGKRVMVWDNTLHWDKNDPETAKLLREGKLTQSDLDFANFALDEWERTLEDALVQRERRSSKEIFVEGKAREKAKELIKRNWRRGWLPSVERQASESIGAGEFKAARASYMKGFRNTANIFGDDVQGVTSGEDSVMNAYLDELEDVASWNTYGGSVRLARLGLMERDGKLVLSNPQVNASRSRNIEDVLSYTRLATDRQIVHENETLPVAHAVKAALRAQAELLSVDQKFHLQYVGDYLDKMVYNKEMEGALDKFMPAAANIAPAMNAVISTISFTGVALNWKVALASGALNTVQALGFAFSGTFAKDGYFSMQDWSRALRFSTTKDGWKLLNALGEVYFIDDWQEADLARSFRKSKTSRTMTGNHFLNWGNWVTDHYMRCIVMAAQMMKEGSFEAHSLGKDGEVIYDEKKDRRFYDGKGNFTKDGKALRANMLTQLISDGVQKDPEGPLKQGYDMRSSRNFKYIADKYIIGAMDRSQQAMLNGVWYGKMMTTFKNFMVSRIHNWSGRPGESEMGGRYVVERTAGGRELVGWEKRRTTSYLYSMAALMRNVKESSNMGLDAWGKLRPEEKRMMAKMAFDVIVFIAAYAAYAALTSPPELPEDDDDGLTEQERKARKEGLAEWKKRLFSILWQIAEDGYVGSPIQLLNTYGGTNYGPVPLITYGVRLLQLPMNPSKAFQFLPGSTTAKDTWELLSNTFGEQEK